MRIFLVLGFLMTLINPNKQTAFVVASQKLSVKGETSFGSFECHYHPNQKDTLFLNQTSSFLSFDIPVKDFGCGNFMLNRDFRKTVKEKEHPLTKVRIHHLRKRNEIFTCDLQIELAGTKKQVHNVVLSKYKNHYLGKTHLNFSDFHLSPPKKMGGMIQVKEQIEISIEVDLK